jgi:hypothetical protein
MSIRILVESTSTKQPLITEFLSACTGSKQGNTNGSFNPVRPGPLYRPTKRRLSTRPPHHSRQGASAANPRLPLKLHILLQSTNKKTIVCEDSERKCPARPGGLHVRARQLDEEKIDEKSIRTSCIGADKSSHKGE